MRLLLLLCLLPTACFAQPLASRANIVLLFIDDLGWKDVGCYGNDFVETPHIDRLAREGMRFTDFYAAGAVCSPTRCAVQSGQNQARIGITAHIPGHWRPFEKVITPQCTMALPLETKTVAESLKDAGYRTGYVGKWHLGDHTREGPGKQGYDFSAVINGPHFYGKYRCTDPALQPKSGQYRTEFEADLAVDFINKHKDQPFFLMVSPYAVHIPLGAMADKVEKYRKKAGGGDHLPHPVYAAMVEHVDDLVGEIVAAVDQQGLAEKTLILFTSDNGGLHKRYDYQAEADAVVTTNAPLRDEKGSLYEGGIRVPLIARWPGHIAPGTECHDVAISYDFFPTFLDMAGAGAPENQVLDGLSLLPLFKDAQAKLNRESVYWHYPHYHHSRPAGALRKGPWKYIEFYDGSPAELYDLRTDIGETRNLASLRKGMMAAYRKELDDWRKQVVARMPLPNPHHDPERAGEWWSRRSGKPIDSSARKPFPQTEKELRQR